jgi:hypothetical protein
MDSQELLDGYRRILQTIYNPREYFERASAFLGQLGNRVAFAARFLRYRGSGPLALPAGLAQQLPRGVLEILCPVPAATIGTTSARPSPWRLWGTISSNLPAQRMRTSDGWTQPFIHFAY